MSDLWKENGSFLFGTCDMFETYGIKLTERSIPQDVLMPGLRARKQTIPMRHGAYDYGAHYYDERAIVIECVTKKMISRDQSREIAYMLARKSEIRFWTEPEKYYIGRVYEAPTLEQLRNVGNRFTLTFICEPFAYRNNVTAAFVNRVYSPNYDGTAPTPTQIIITNTSATTSIRNITIVQTIKKESL